jgi:hypothetical protein
MSSPARSRRVQASQSVFTLRHTRLTTSLPIARDHAAVRHDAEEQRRTSSWRKERGNDNGCIKEDSHVFREVRKASSPLFWLSRLVWSRASIAGRDNRDGGGQSPGDRLASGFCFGFGRIDDREQRDPVLAPEHGEAPTVRAE